MSDLNFKLSSVIVIFIVRIRSRVRVGFASLGLLDLLNSGLENGHRQKGRGGRELWDWHRWDFWIVLRNKKHIRCLMVVAFTVDIQTHVTFLANRSMLMTSSNTRLEPGRYISSIHRIRASLSSSLLEHPNLGNIFWNIQLKLSSNLHLPAWGRKRFSCECLIEEGTLPTDRVLPSARLSMERRSKNWSSANMSTWRNSKLWARYCDWHLKQASWQRWEFLPLNLG